MGRRSDYRRLKSVFRLRTILGRHKSTFCLGSILVGLYQLPWNVPCLGVSLRGFRSPCTLRVLPTEGGRGETASERVSARMSARIPPNTYWTFQNTIDGRKQRLSLRSPPRIVGVLAVGQRQRHPRPQAL